MNGTVVFFIAIGLLAGAILGVGTRFFHNFGANIARNRMEDMGVDFPEQPEDETDERLR